MEKRVLVKKATADLTGKEGYAVKLSADANYVEVCTAATDEAIGVLQRVNTLGLEVEVVMFGYCGLSVSGTVKSGQVATLTTASRFTGGKTDGAVFMAVFEQDGVSGDIVPAFVFPGARHELG